MRNADILKGLKKCDHFKDQQKLRAATDHDIIMALERGIRITQPDGRTRYNYGFIVVVVDHEDRVLITIHPGDRPAKSTKLFSLDQAKAIKAKFQAA